MSNSDNEESREGDRTWWMRATLPSGTAQWLIDSVQQDDVDDLYELLNHKSMDSTDRIKETDVEQAFYFAANGHADACRVLYHHLSVTAQRNYWLPRKNFGWFPLHKAVKRGHGDVVRVLIRECQFNPNQINHEHVTPLVCAVHSPFWLEMGRLLLDSGASPNCSTTHTNNPLFLAVERSNVDLIRLLLRYKADPNFTHGARSARRVARFLRRDDSDDENDDSDDDDDDDEEEDVPHNPAHTFVPLYFAVTKRNVQVTRLLLKHGADPNLHRLQQFGDSARYDRGYDPLVTDIAIKNGDADILSMLLNRGALCAAPGHRIFHRTTALNDLLEDASKSDQTKQAICRILVKKAKTCHVAKRFVHGSLDAAIFRKRNYQFLLQAGVNPICSLYRAIAEQLVKTCEFMVKELGMDPFLEQEEDDGRDDPFLCGEIEESPATSPFLAAARNEEESVFELFLEHWDQRFAANGGKNDSGDYPIHVICCDKEVSLHAVELLLELQPHTLSTVDGEKGLFPFIFAAMWDANVEVIYFLMRQCPDALGRVPQALSPTKAILNDTIITNPTAALDASPVPVETSAVLETTANDGEWRKSLGDGPLKKKPKVSL